MNYSLNWQLQLVCNDSDLHRMGHPSECSGILQNYAFPILVLMLGIPRNAEKIFFLTSSPSGQWEIFQQLQWSHHFTPGELPLLTSVLNVIFLVLIKFNNWKHPVSSWSSKTTLSRYGIFDNFIFLIWERHVYWEASKILCIFINNLRYISTIKVSLIASLLYQASTSEKYPCVVFFFFFFSGCWVMSWPMVSALRFPKIFCLELASE